MAFTTAVGTKKKVCYYYDGMGHPECVNEKQRLMLAAQLVGVAAAGKWMVHHELANEEALMRSL